MICFGYECLFLFYRCGIWGLGGEDIVLVVSGRIELKFKFFVIYGFFL